MEKKAWWELYKNNTCFEQILDAIHYKQQFYGRWHLISQTIQLSLIRRAGHCLRSKNDLISNVL